MPLETALRAVLAAPRCEGALPLGPLRNVCSIAFGPGSERLDAVDLQVLEGIDDIVTTAYRLGSLDAEGRR